MGEKIPRLAGLIDIVAWIYALKEKTMTDLIDWVEKAGLENLKFRLQNAETLAKESATTLTVLLAGMAGSLTYAVKYFEAIPTSTPMAVGSGVLSAWLMVLSGMLVHFCIRTLPLPTPTNEPLNLYQPEFAIDELRAVELKNIQGRIEQAITRNAMIAVWLDRIRYCAVASPLVFVISALVAKVH